MKFIKPYYVEVTEEVRRSNVHYVMATSEQEAMAMASKEYGSHQRIIQTGASKLDSETLSNLVMCKKCGGIEFLTTQYVDHHATYTIGKDGMHHDLREYAQGDNWENVGVNEWSCCGCGATYNTTADIIEGNFYE